VVVHGDALEMHGHARGGNDALTAGFATHVVLYGDAQTMSDDTRGGDDALTGGPVGLAGVNDLFGDAFEMHDRATGGDDQLSGGAGSFLISCTATLASWMAAPVAAMMASPGAASTIRYMAMPSRCTTRPAAAMTR